MDEQTETETPESQENPPASAPYPPPESQENPPPANQQYPPPVSEQQYAQPMNQQYAPPANQQYAAPVNQQYQAPANQQYQPPPNQYYQPPVNQQYVPPVNQQYAPPGGHYAQAAQPQYNYAQPAPVQYQMPATAPVGTYQPAVPMGQGAWSTGLFDCFADIPHFCLTTWCPCIPFGRVAEIVDKGSSSCGMAGALYSLILLFTGCQFIYSCTYRTKIRLQYGIPGDDVADFCTHFWCEPCALCQEYRELTARGFDLPLGWHGNMARQSQGVNMAPVAPGGMSR